MRNVYKYWEELKSHKKGYSVAEITFDASDTDRDFFGKERKNLQSAINDGARYIKKNQDAYIDIFAHARLYDYYDDGALVRTDEECALIGHVLRDGSYFDMCEPVDWLND